MYSGVPKTAKPRSARSRSVAGRSLAVGQRGREPEVEQLHVCGSEPRSPARSHQHQVLRLEVAVHEPGGVRRLERLRRLDCDAHGLAPLERAALQARVERLARAELHREKGAPVERLAEVVELHHVAVREVRDRARLVPEALESAGRGGVLGPQDLHGELASELDVLRLVHAAARPFAELAPETVRRARRAASGSEGVIRVAIASLTGPAAGVAEAPASSVARASRKRRANSVRDRAGSCGQSLRIIPAMRDRTPRSCPSTTGADDSSFARSPTARPARA